MLSNMWMFDIGSGDGFQEEARRAGYVIIIRKDGVVSYCTNAWVDKDRGMCLEFSGPRSVFFIPKLFDTCLEAKAWLEGWQRSFPADADGWLPEIGTYEC